MNTEPIGRPGKVISHYREGERFSIISIERIPSTWPSCCSLVGSPRIDDSFSTLTSYLVHQMKFQNSLLPRISHGCASTCITHKKSVIFLSFKSRSAEESQRLQALKIHFSPGNARFPHRQQRPPLQSTR